jgi:glycosyltransferase involved in cell wall biosynthesis
MKKVCHITTVHTWDDTRIFIKECRSSASSGFNTFLIATAEEDFVRDGVHVLSLPFHIGSNRIIRSIKRLKAAKLRALSLNADIYHIHDPELIFLGLFLSRRGYTVIYDSHEDLPRQILGKPYLYRAIRKTVAWIAELVENFVVKRISGVVVSTPFIYDRFIEINKNVTIIQNFPILDEFINLKPQFPSEIPNNVCYVGGLTEIRGVGQMLNLLDANQNLFLTIAGPCSDDFSKDKFAQYSSHPRLNYLGKVDRKGVSEVLEKSSLGLLILHPNENYLMSYPVKLFEYMATGLPVIASNFPFWKQIIGDDDCVLFVDPFDSLDIQKAVSKILSNPKMAREMGKKGRKSVLKKYNWATEEKKLIELYNELMTKEPGLNEPPT